MRCLTCDYPLKDLTESRCPECGRAFNPQDSSTFSITEDRRRPVRWAVRVGVVAYLLIFAMQLRYDPTESLIIMVLASIPVPLILAGVVFAVLE